MDRCKVFVGNIPFRASKSKVWKFFDTFGQVSDVHLAVDKITGKRKNFGFVKFSDPSGASNAIEADNTDSLVLCGRRMRTSPARAKSRPSCEAPVRVAAADDTDETSLVSPISQLPDELLEQILTQLPLATQLRVQRVCSRWCAMVESALARLHVLDLGEAFGYWCGLRLTDRTLHSLLRRTPNLRRLLSGGHTRHCTQRALATIGRLCPHLVEIDLNGFNIDERSLRQLTSRCRQLQLVHLPSKYNFTEGGVSTLLTQLPQLQRLHLNASHRVTGVCLRHLPASLQVLNVAGCQQLEVDKLAALSQCQLPLLHELDMSDVPLLSDYLCLRILSAMPALVTLRLCRLNLAFDRSLAPVAMQLLHLDLSESAISDDTLRQLAPQLQQLRSLVLDSCLDLTPDGLCHVTAAPRLSRLSLSLLPTVDATVLRALASMALTEISLAESFRGPADFTGEDLQHLIVEAEQLQVLDLSGVSVVTLDLLQECAEKRVQMADSVATRDALSCLVVKAGGTAVTMGPSGCMFVVKEDSQPHCPAQYPRLELPAMHVLDFDSVPMHMRKFDEEDIDDMDEYNYSDDDSVYEDDSMDHFVFCDDYEEFFGGGACMWNHFEDSD